MNPTPLHPIIVHFPLALGFLLPVIALVVAFFIKKGRFTAQTWLMVVGLQVFMLIAGYAALQTGEREEMIVEHVTGKPPLQEHEARAEMFVAGTVAATALVSVVPFLRPALHFYVQLGTVVLMLMNAFLGYRAGDAGGALVYKYGAANGYLSAQNSAGEEAAAEGLLPTPGQNTSESENPVDEADGSHEGNEDSTEESEDEEPETPVHQ